MAAVALVSACGDDSSSGIVTFDAAGRDAAVRDGAVAADGQAMDGQSPTEGGGGLDADLPVSPDATPPDGFTSMIDGGGPEDVRLELLDAGLPSGDSGDALCLSSPGEVTCAADADCKLVIKCAACCPAPFVTGSHETPSDSCTVNGTSCSTAPPSCGPPPGEMCGSCPPLPAYVARCVEGTCRRVCR